MKGFLDIGLGLEGLFVESCCCGLVAEGIVAVLLGLVMWVDFWGGGGIEEDSISCRMLEEYPLAFCRTPDLLPWRNGALSSANEGGATEHGLEHSLVA